MKRRNYRIDGCFLSDSSWRVTCCLLRNTLSNKASSATAASSSRYEPRQLHKNQSEPRTVFSPISVVHGLCYAHQLEEAYVSLETTAALKIACARETRRAWLLSVHFLTQWLSQSAGSLKDDQKKNVTKRMLGLIDYARLMPDSVIGKETWRIMPPTRNNAIERLRPQPTRRTSWKLQCESKKSPPRGYLNLFFIFHKRLRIINRLFTHLLYVPMYARLQIFIQLSPTLKKLCHIKRDYLVHIICAKCPKRAKSRAFRRLRKSLIALLIVVCGKSL